MSLVRIGRAWSALLTLILVLAGLAIVAPEFFTEANLRDLALANVPVLIVALGMTLVIVLGQIDISVGSIFAICAVTAGAAAQSGLPMPLVALVAILVGLVLGAVNGVLISYVRAPSIVVTLATMTAWREALRLITGGAWIENLPTSFQWFGLSQWGGQLVIVLLSLLVFAAIWWATRNLAGFRMIFATGSDADAANLAGIDTRLVLLSVFCLMGALTGLASILNAVRFSDVPANAGVGLELKTIAAVVVGGTPITGGRATLLGTLLGVCLLGCLGPALTYVGLSAYWEKAIQGAIILATVLFEALMQSRRGRALKAAA